MLLAGKRVFIIEDNAVNMMIYRTMLESEGAKVAFEPWGQYAVGMLRAEARVDAIILDLMLDFGVSGFDVFDQIRKFPQFNNVPIVAVSASDPAVAMARAQAKGFSGFIAKPIDDDVFPQQLADIITGKPIWYSGGR
jgi:CheY-like chemotaxis protein